MSEKEIEVRVNEILELVNKMPIPTKEGRIKFAQFLINESFNNEQEQAFEKASPKQEEQAFEKASPKQEQDEKNNDQIIS